ncbi:MAG: hypothetical protein OEW04_04580 [Nitrospirota bacterium]|nr:hypothetical protein [Nitrospirota bacterium]
MQRAKELFDEIDQAGRKHDKKRTLVDITGMLQFESAPVIERFEIAAYVGETQTRGTRTAFLLSEKQMMPDKFGENVAVNRGGNVITTTDLKEALEWLGVASANEAVGGDV